ncbi:MAG: metallophosphoesterase [Nitrospirae bacterium]|nr:metallophosphoesterase [Nitrospirota bacterium]
MESISIMLRGRVAIAVFVFLAGIYASTGCPEASVCSGNVGRPFSFIVFGDSRDNVSGVSPVLTRLVQTMATHVDGDKPAPSFAVFMGDAATAGGPGNLKLWDNITSGLSTKIPVLFVKGNHDIYGGSLNGFSLDGDFQAFQKERLETGVSINSRCIQRLPGNSGYSAFSFVWDGSLFVILDTYDMPMPGHQYNGWVSSRQRDMLEKELDNTTPRHKFVFYHTPAFDNAAHGNISKSEYMGSWSADFMDIWKIIDKNAVDIVFSGHSHYYARRKIDTTVNPGWRNGVLQVISGGAGAPFNDPQSCVGSFCFKYDNPPEISKIYHFIIVTVTKEVVSYKLYDVNDKQIEEYVISKN